MWNYFPSLALHEIMYYVNNNKCSVENIAELKKTFSSTEH